MEQDWKQVAAKHAAVAHENHFHTRRALWPIDDAPGVFAYIDNNPYAGDPRRRDRELQAMREWLSERGYDVLATAAYPALGDEDAGYTRTLVLRIAPHAVSELLAMMEAIRGQNERPN